MGTEPAIPQYLSVTDESTCRFTGSAKDIGRCAVAVMIDAIADFHLGIDLSAASTHLTHAGRQWEAVEVFNGRLLLRHDTSYLLLDIFGKSDQHCRTITFAADVEEDTSIDGDTQSYFRHQRAVALERMLHADL